MYVPPITVNDILYVPGYFFDDLIRMGQIPDYRFEVKKDLSPESYYASGEEVFIGTRAEQDAYKPTDENGDARYMKRIIVDKNGNAHAVVTEKLRAAEAADRGINISVGGYSDLFASARVNPDPDDPFGKMCMSGYIIYESMESNTPIAYIPPEYQINVPTGLMQPDVDE